jgi:hypothetical protein
MRNNLVIILSILSLHTILGQKTVTYTDEIVVYYGRNKPVNTSNRYYPNYDRYENYNHYFDLEDDIVISEAQAKIKQLNRLMDEWKDDIDGHVSLEIEPETGFGFSSNGVYYGQWKNGKKNGYGKTISEDFQRNKTVFEGSWKNNKKHGIGTITYPSGATFSGEWRIGVVHGKGKSISKNGRVTVGNWKNGSLNGYAKMNGPDGFMLRGNFIQDKLYGYGEVIEKNGDVYKGNWYKDQPEGRGFLKFNPNNPDKYERYYGDFNRGMFHGNGYLKYENGDVFNGKFEYGTFNGYGSLTKEDGSNLQGEWKKGKKEGFFLSSKGDQIEIKSYASDVEIDSNEEDNISNIKNSISENLTESRFRIQNEYVDVKKRFRENSQNNIVDPVFNSKEQLDAHLALSQMNQYAVDKSFEKAFENNEINTAQLRFVQDYQNNLNNLLEFSKGLSEGFVTLTIGNIKDNIVQIGKITMVLMEDPQSLVDVTIELYDAVSEGKVTKAIEEFIDIKFDEFSTGTPFKKGEMVKELLTSVLADAALGGGLSTVAKIGKGSRLGYKLNKLAKASKTYTKETLSKGYEIFNSGYKKSFRKIENFSELAYRSSKKGIINEGEFKDFMAYGSVILSKSSNDFKHIDDLYIARRQVTPELGDTYVNDLPDLDPTDPDSMFHSFDGTILKGTYEPGEVLFQAQRLSQNGELGQWFTPIKPLDARHADELTNIFKHKNFAEVIKTYVVKEKVSGYAGKVKGELTDSQSMSRGYQFYVNLESEDLAKIFIEIKK